MRRYHAIFAGALLLGGAAGAAETAPVRELDPVHVNAMRNPEVRKYKAILAGLDTFDKHHRLAPAVDKLHFRLTLRGTDDAPAPLAARLVGDNGFKLPISIDATQRFVVPRSAAAADADSELELNRKRRVYRVMPDIRTPGIAANQRRLGDLRLECKVMFAIAKEEIPLWGVLLINGVLMTTEWCSFFDNKRDVRMDYQADLPVSGALLIEGNRSALLETKGNSFQVPIGDSSWSDDAVVQLSFAGPATIPAAETPRTAP